MTHLDPRHPYERFVSRLSTSAHSERPHISYLVSHISLRMWLYGCLSVLVVASLLWLGVKTHGIASASADSINQADQQSATARAAALRQSKLSAIDLLKKAVPMIESPECATAIELLTEASRRDPGLRDAEIELGYAYIKNGDWQSAKTALDKAKAIDGSWPDTYMLLAAVDHQLGDKAGEQEALARADQFALISKLSELTK